eukprot:scaffold34664_cov240-Amphora_coffeaeformis.AAC.4
MTTTTTPVPDIKDLTFASRCDVVIVGAGVAGASAAYHLSQQQQPPLQVVVLDAAAVPGTGIAPRYSGSATMTGRAPVIKMMIQLYAARSAEFIHHHGFEGAARYLRITAAGLQWQKQLAQTVFQETDENQELTQMRQLGSYYVAYPQDRDALRQEFELLQQLGECPGLSWIEDDKVLQAIPGWSPEFTCAIYFPDDGVIDSTGYAAALLQYACAPNKSTGGGVTFRGNAKVKHVSEQEEGTVVELESGELIHCQHVIMATGGLMQIPALNGLLRPCYSYLTHVPIPTAPDCQTSSNFFTWNFTHDWCFTNKAVRMSGEDHFCAYKDPKVEARCANLARWTLERYGCDVDEEALAKLPQHYGIYSETPDCVPLIGTLQRTSRICYLLGCNAWGQTVLSYASSLVPALLGYTKMTDEQRDAMKLFSIRRFTKLPKT